MKLLRACLWINFMYMVLLLKDLMLKQYIQLNVYLTNIPVQTGI